MGQKVNPISNRLGISTYWKSRWYSENFKQLKEDLEIRNYLNIRLAKGFLSSIYIERTNYKIFITIYSSRPAIIIGKLGNEIEKLKQGINKILKQGINKKQININILEVKIPEVDALLIAKNIANQIENRLSYKKARKFAIYSALRKKVEGIKIQISGRLNGTEMARTEFYKEGRIPFSTFRANIDYATYEAHTTYGKLGLKVWIMKGVVYSKKELYILNRIPKKKIKITYVKAKKKEI
ncbi:30S ribosomal protein S3 [Candidatus Karelsulcia muelleri]|uniref:30S ribosomal protein S3 n=1 Tax=Candidatus Karelsulcia muelleri TaxID=336810 RepID=UPI002367FB91|nr:30S ribosomal protein S3 [Candidatus Karelsulcia muelleri]WDI79591.1 30S ribosomal protein S3 [Candidatus Karelsulcia muelleri]